jgi:hypothetical protein
MIFFWGMFPFWAKRGSPLGCNGKTDFCGFTDGNRFFWGCFILGQFGYDGKTDFADLRIFTDFKGLKELKIRKSAKSVLPL